MRSNGRANSLNTLVAAAGLAISMPALAQFGGFGEVQSQEIPIRAGMTDLAGGDVTGDGLNDIVWVDADGRVGFIAGFDDGVFDSPPTQVVEPDAEGRAIELVDYDNDGDLDIVRIAAINAGDFRAYRNDGTGNFEFDFAITGFGNIITDSGLEFGDVDGDGDRDLIILVDNGVEVIENLGGDFSRTPITSVFANFSAQGFAVGDMDGDGRADVAALSSSNDSVYVARSDGANLTEIDRFSPGGSVQDIKLMNMDPSTDSDLDLIVTNQGAPLARASIYRNTGAADFEFAYGLTFDSPREVEVVDIDGDGDIDVLAEGKIGFDPEAIVVFLNDGDGSFDRQDTVWDFVSDSVNTFELIDIDPMTGPDLVGIFGNFSQEVTVRLNQTAFTAPTEPVLLTPDNGANDLALPSQVAAWGGPVAPAVTWERAEGLGVTYSVVVSESPSLSSPVFEATGITSRSADLSTADLQPGTTYYWTVFADNRRGSTEPTGGPFSFTTAAGDTACRVDFDGDGELTLFDFLAFSTAFDAGCP